MPRDFLMEENQISDVPQGRDFLESNGNEPLSESFGKAIPRMWEDATRAGFNFIKDIPGYYQSAKTELPGALNVLTNHPAHAIGQALAGSQEMINNLAQFPSGVAHYASDRLNLLPKSATNLIDKITPEDTGDAIDKLFDNPKYEGENLIRGITRNAFNIAGLGKVASTINPLNLTSKSIAKDIVNSEALQKKEHNKLYNGIWSDAEKTGFNHVPINEKLLSDNLSVIEKYKTPKEYQSLENFILNPSLQNAQKAQSDMGIIHRKLEENSRNRSLTSEERALYNAAKESENHIESNMFKNNKGNVNQLLKDKYSKVTASYRDNVVPYKYNSAIQAFKNKEMLPNELINSLSKGEFMAKRGSFHPELKLRKLILPVLGGATAIGLGNKLYSTSMGTHPQNPFADENKYEGSQ